MRIRIHFAKTEAMRFTSHLDLHRTWERTLRRARLPLSYSQGFKPHPRIVLASALPLGFTSQDEVVDIWLEERLPLAGIVSDLRSAAPPGLQILNCNEVEFSDPALPTQVVASEFLITFSDSVYDLDRKVDALIKAPNLPRTWRDKPYDLRPLILDLQLLPADGDSKQKILAILVAQEGATGRPEEIVRALGKYPDKVHIHRIRIVFR
jgi:radical SAM-linked protein